MTPMKALEIAAANMFVVRLNMTKEGKGRQYKYVVLKQELIEVEGEPLRVRMAGWAQFRVEEEAEWFAAMMRKRWLEEALKGPSRTPDQPPAEDT